MINFNRDIHTHAHVFLLSLLLFFLFFFIFLLAAGIGIQFIVLTNMIKIFGYVIAFSGH
jgi:hypothetical protein